jgi:hypothetical protein
MFSKKIISFLFVSFLIVTVSHAQCKIYRGRYASGSPVGVVEGNKIYKGRYASGSPVGVIEGNKIYQGRYASGSPIAVTQNGGGACGLAAAAYFLLL